MRYFCIGVFNLKWVIFDISANLVGDLIASGILLGGLVRKGHAIRPPFEDNPQMVGRELNALLKAGGCRFHMGHGGPLEAGEVARHAAYLATCEPGRIHRPQVKA